MTRLHILKILLVIGSIAVVFSSAVAAFTVYWDETPIVFDVQPKLVSGSVMVPITVARNNFGAEVHWAFGEEAADIVWSDFQLAVKVGDNAALRDGVQVTVDPAPRMEQGFLMVPLRFLANQMGIRVNTELASGALRLSWQEEPRSVITAFASEAPKEADGQQPESSERILSLREREEMAARLASETGAAIIDEHSEDDEQFTANGEGDPVLDPTHPRGQIEPDRAFEAAVDLETAWQELLSRIAATTEPGDLRSIEYIGGSRSRVRIDLEHFSDYHTILLTEPDRLVIDLFGVEGEGLPEKIIEGPLVRSIRSARFNDVMRIVFVLNQETGYDIRYWPDTGLEVEFDYHINDVFLTRETGHPQLHIVATDHPDFDVIQLTEPRRLVLDFSNSTLAGGAKEFFVGQGAVKSIRVSQFMPSVVRIVLDLYADVTPLGMAVVDGEYVLNLYEGSEAAARVYQQRLDREAAAAGDAAPLPSFVLPTRTAQAAPSADALLSGFVIVVDPGHGGSDPGAIGPRGTFEKDIVLAIGLYLGKMLTEAGADVVYTRETDKYVSIFERPAIAAEAAADLFVSIHSNSYMGNSARGIETLYHPRDPKNQLFAEILQAEVVKAVQLVDRGLRQRTNLAVLNHSNVTSALVEVGFINHREEELLLRSDSVQKSAAEGIFNGIVRYLEAVYR